MRLFVATLSALALASPAFAATAHAPAGHAAGSSTTSDERCLLGMVLLAQSGKDQNSKAFGQAGAIYFNGRLARSPGYNYAQLKALAGTIDLSTIQADLKEHCGPEFESSMKQMMTALAPPKGAVQPAAPAAAPAAPAPAPAAPAGAPPIAELPH